MKVWATLWAMALVLVAGGCRTAAGTDALEKVRQAVAAKQAVLVDVREQAEWDAGHLAGAQLVPLSRLQAEGAAKLELPKDRPLYLYCRSGRRSKVAEQLLRQQGYQAESLAAGYQELVQKGFPAGGR